MAFFKDVGDFFGSRHSQQECDEDTLKVIITYVGITAVPALMEILATRAGNECSPEMITDISDKAKLASGLPIRCQHCSATFPLAESIDLARANMGEATFTCPSCREIIRKVSGDEIAEWGMARIQAWSEG